MDFDNTPKLFPRSCHVELLHLPEPRCTPGVQPPDREAAKGDHPGDEAAHQGAQQAHGPGPEEAFRQSKIAVTLLLNH